MQCSKSNTAQYSTVSDKLSVQQVQTTGNVQNVLLLECMPELVDATV